MKKATQGFASVIVGVLLYCLVVAPLVKSGGYLDVARDSFFSIGLGFIAAITVVYALWVAVIFAKTRLH